MNLATQNLQGRYPEIASFAGNVNCGNPAWYAVRTKSNCEKVVALGFEGKGYESYLPVYRDRRRWSDRVVESDKPLFPGYVFCRFDGVRRLPVITIPGVASIVGFGAQPAPVPESELEAVRSLLRNGSGIATWPYLAEGQRIRIERGTLEGLEGIQIRTKREWRVVVSVTLLQRSVSVEIDRECVSAIEQ